LAWDDPVVWILIIAVVIFLFGANKIPQFARSIGQARKEFDKGWKGTDDITRGSTSVQAVPPPPPPAGVLNQLYAPPSTSSPSFPPTPVQGHSTQDPLIVAAEKEGIQTEGKTREQIASELSWKLNKK
jgi:sec-independent protein translocase protein TatA